MANSKTNQVYCIFKGTDGKDIAIYGVKDIYDGLKTALGCQVLPDGGTPPNDALKVNNINQALANGVARISIQYTKSGRNQVGYVLCSASSADTVLSSITSLKFRNSKIVSARFLG